MAKAKKRDDFSPSTMEAISKRAAYICSNTDRRGFTICMSESDSLKRINTVRAAYIG